MRGRGLMDAIDVDSAVAEAAPNALIGTTPEGTVTYWNAAAERLYGHTRAEALGSSLFDLVVPPLHGDELARIRAEAARGLERSCEMVRRCKDGSLIYVQALV